MVLRFKQWFIVCIMLLAAMFSALPLKGVYAATATYSDVLADLQTDPSFHAEDYPAKSEDFSLQVIQTAESVNSELFVYVYQPAAKKKQLTATNINMSLSEEATGTTLYGLELVSNEGVFAKYRVKGFTVLNNKAIRYYNITSIYRKFDASIDDGYKNEDLLNKISFRVGKVFTATTINGKIIYSQQPTYTVKIINPVTDYLTHVASYGSGGLWWIKGGHWNIFDSHFIAFSTDWDIDRLVSADISYHYCSATAYYDELFGFELNSDISYGEDKETVLTVNADDSYKHTSSIHGLTYSTYSWTKINSTEDFIAAVKSTNGLSHNNAYNNLENILAGSEWVINFIETERTQKDTNAVGIYKKYTSDFTKISNVTVLRLEFESDGKVYNLGAVSDMVSAEYPEEGSRHWYDGFVNFFEKLKNFTWWQWLLVILAAVVIVCLIICIVKFGIRAVVKAILWILQKIVQALWWLICLPFRGIAALFFKRRESAPAKAKTTKSKPRTERREENYGKEDTAAEKRGKR